MTLIEVMMVVFIIGLATGLVVLTLPPNPTPEQSDARVFAQNLSTAQDQAILSGQPVGLFLHRDGYTLQSWRAGRWEPVNGGANLSRGTQLDFRGGEREAPPEGWPHYIFDPTGVSLGADFQVRGRSERIDIVVNTNGEVQVETH